MELCGGATLDVEETTKSSRVGTVLRAAVCFKACLLFLVLCYWHRRVVVDDPWITFRYARNLANGEGLCFNPGERIEGFSNFTWVLVSAFGAMINVEPLGFARLVAILLALLLICLMCFGAGPTHTAESAREETVEEAKGWLARIADLRLGGGHAAWEAGFLRLIPRSATAALLLAACYPFAVWTMGGLETTLYTATIFLFTVSLAFAVATGQMSTGLLAGAALAFAALSRPEAPMFFSVLLYALLIAPREHRRPLLAAAGLFLAVTALFLTARYLYFGTVIPNTVSAKVGGSTGMRLLRGLVYTGRYFMGPPGLLLVLAVWALLRLRLPWHRGDRRPSSFLARICGAVVVMQFLFVLGVGGDWMPASRFLVPILPPLCLLAAMTLRSWPAFVRWVLVFFFLLGSLFQAYRDPLLRWYRWAAKEQGGTLLIDPLKSAGKWLRANAPAGSLVASSEAGVVPYYSELPYIDMLGLVDKHIAALPGDLHQQYDAAYVLSRQPQYILLQLEQRDGAMRPAWPSDREMYELEQFQREYHEKARFPRLLTGDIMPSLREGALVVYTRAEPDT